MKDLAGVDWVEVRARDRMRESGQPSSPTGRKPPRKKRSDQWYPVWAWLESRPPEQSKTILASDIDEWLLNNPETTEELLKQHPRKYLHNYIRKCFHAVRRKTENKCVEPPKAAAVPVSLGLDARRTQEAKQGKQIVVLSSSSNSSGARELCGIGDSSLLFSDDAPGGRCEVSVEYDGCGDGGGDPGPSVRKGRQAGDELEQKKAIGCAEEKNYDVMAMISSEELDGDDEAGEARDERRPVRRGKDQGPEMTPVSGPDMGVESGCQMNDTSNPLRRKTAQEAQGAEQQPLLDELDEPEDDINLTIRRAHIGHPTGALALNCKKRTKRLKSAVIESHTSSHTSAGKVMKKEWVYLAVRNGAFSNGFAWVEKTSCGYPRPNDPEYRRFCQAKLDMLEELVWPLDGWLVRVRQRLDIKQYDAYMEHRKVQMRSAKEIQRYLEQHPEWSRNENQSGRQKNIGKLKSLGLEASAMKDGRTEDKHWRYTRRKLAVEEVPDNHILWSKVYSEINRYNCLVALHIRLRQYLADYQVMKRAAFQKSMQLRDSESADVNVVLEHETRSSVSMAMSGDEGYSRPPKLRKLGPWPSAEECYMHRDEVSSVPPAVLPEEDDTPLQSMDGNRAGERDGNRDRVADEPTAVQSQRIESTRRSTRWLRMRIGGRRVPNLTAQAASSPAPAAGGTDSWRPLMTAWAICKASAEHEFGLHGAAAIEQDEPAAAPSGPRREKEVKGYGPATKDGRNAGVGAKGAGRGGLVADTLRNRKTRQDEYRVSRSKARCRTLDYIFEREMVGSIGSWSHEVGRSRKRWTSLCQGWHTLGKPFAGPGVWVKRRSHKLLLPTWCSYTSSATTVPTAWGSAIELQPVQKVLDLRFHPGGAPQLVSGCSAAPNELLLFNVATGRVTELAGHNCLVQAVEYVPSGDRIVSCGGNVLKVWDSATGECLHTMGPGPATDGDEGPPGHIKNISALTVNSFQGNLLVSSGEVGDTRLLLWNIASGELISDLNASLRERNSVIPQVDALQFATPTTLVCGSDSGQGQPAQVQLWDIETQSEHITIHAHDSYIMCLDVTPSGNMIVTGAGDGTTALFDARSHGGIARIPLTQDCEVTSVSFSPCGVYFQASCSSNFALIFDMRMMPLNPDPQWNPLGRPMIPATQAQRHLRPLHCLSHGKPMPTVQNAGQMPGFVDVGDQGVNDARWFHSSSRLVTASGNGSVAVWDVSLGEPCVKTIASHTRSANAIAITSDDLIFASGGDDQKVVLYQDFKNPKRAPWRLSLPVMQPPLRELALDP